MKTKGIGEMKEMTTYNMLKRFRELYNISSPKKRTVLISMIPHRTYFHDKAIVEFIEITDEKEARKILENIFDKFLKRKEK